jgi:hypothetical protein
VTRYKNYKILRESDPHYLELLVKDFLLEGWVPVGGLVYSPPGDYLQAVALPEELV